MTKTVLLGDVISQASLWRYDGNDYPVLSMTMHDGIVMQKDRFKKDISSTDKSNYKIVKKGQLVIGFPIDEGVIYIQDIAEKGIMSPAYNIWDVKQDLIDTKFLELCLHSPQSMAYYRSKLRGTTARRRSIPTEDLLNLRINLPDIKEQKRRTTYLRIVDSIISKRRNQLELTYTIVKSRFIEMFGDPIKNSKGLPLIRLGDYCYLKAGVTTPADVIHEYSEEYNVPCYGGNGIRGYVKEATQNGEYPIIGRQGALCGNVKLAKGSFHATEHAVLVKALKPANTVWLYLMLMFMDLCRCHTGAAQPGLAVKTLNTILVPEAEIELQNQFADFVAQVDKSKLAVQQSLNELETLKKSLMQQYFG